MSVIHVMGRLGSGKTMYAVQQIFEALRSGKDVYTNVRLVDFFAWKIVKALPVRNIVRFFVSHYSHYKLFERWEVVQLQEHYHYYKNLKDFVKDEGVHEEREESSRLFVWDEIHLELNARDWKSENKEVVRFFTLSRKMGFDVIIVSQIQGAIDKQIRELADVTYEIKNLNRFIKFLNFGVLVKRWQNASHKAKGVWKGTQIISYNTDLVRGLYNTLSLMREDSPRLVYMREVHMCDCCKYKASYLYDKL